MLFFQQQSNAVTRIYSTDNSLMYLTSTFLGQLGGALLQIPKMSKLEFLVHYSFKIYTHYKKILIFWCNSFGHWIPEYI